MKRQGKTRKARLKEQGEKCAGGGKGENTGRKKQYYETFEWQYEIYFVEYIHV